MNSSRDRRNLDLKTSIIDTNIPYIDNPPKNNPNIKNNTLKINRDTYNTYTPPRPPSRSITTSNYSTASFMQRGNYDNVHQRCGDFVIDIEPYHPVTSSGGVSSYSTGGAATMSTNLSSQPSTTLFTTTNTNSTTFDGNLNKKLRELESHN
ncbi:3672_t:CDS:1, partial [Racocetra persica]